MTSIPHTSPECGRGAETVLPKHHPRRRSCPVLILIPTFRHSYYYIDGVMVAKKDFNAPKHETLDVKNLYVCKLMQSLKSRGYVTESFNWRWYYYYLTNEGIEYLRDYLHLDEAVVPDTLKRPATFRPLTRGGPDRGPRGRSDRGDRDNYRRGPRDGDDKKNFGPGGGDFKPEFRKEGGFGRGGGAPRR
eukprot:TRINITY_DN308_c0_g3_i2.p1 TRINITY_DN308_c0_g3~~TRINITY_DN308_c0_g3_i2.p1  ORF type:complete len:189 (-),score=30.56 TRINITY_DN308_c0_g3_i2:273-839(-)